MGYANMEPVNCNLCGEDDFEEIIHRGESNVVRCKKCGLVYRNPRRSSPEEVAQYANVEYTPDYIAHWSSVRRFETYLKMVEKYISKGRLLDIGCQFCAFLRTAKKAGWATYGVDPSNQTYQIGKAHGIDVFHGVLSEAKYPDGCFEVVTMLLVFDQIPDPKGELFEIKRVLKDHGLLAIRVPNVEFHLLVHYLFKKLGKWSAGKDPSLFHIHAFSARTLREMLHQAGFDIVRLANARPTKGDPYSRGGFLRSAGLELFKRGLHAWAQLVYYLSFGQCLLSPSLEVLAIKDR